MKKLLISGASGRMGRLIAKEAESNGFIPVCGVDDRQDTGLPFPVYPRYDDCGEEIDIIIDFSSASALPALLRFAEDRKLPLMLGATGYSREDMERMHNASLTIPLFQSSNMSLGVYVLRMLASQASRMLPGFDIEIVERHHNQKLDAPSGTALTLLEAVKNDKGHPVFGRQGLDARHQEGEIGVHAIRGGTLAGEHEVGFYGRHESLRLTHIAEDRGVFASGAMKIASWLLHQEPGLYGMGDYMSSLGKRFPD